MNPKLHHPNKQAVFSISFFSLHLLRRFIFLTNRWLFLALMIQQPINTWAAPFAAKIVGGQTTGSSDWPWMVALVFRSDTTVFCGGSLIAKNWVLTAAHCVATKTDKNLEVLINRPQLQSLQGERIAVIQYLIHPQFDRLSLRNDIALLKLATPSRVEPIETLPDYSDQDEAGHNAIALGWGNTLTDGESFPDDLRQVILPIVTNAECKQRMPGIEDSMLCAGAVEGGKDTCTGDSGGPLVLFDQSSQSWRQAGITSFGQSTCAMPGYYGVYTRLEHYNTFISEAVCTANQRPATPLLHLSVIDSLYTATWSQSSSATGYRLVYAPYPEGIPINSLDVGPNAYYTAQLPLASDYYVAIKAYSGNCRSNYSTIKHFFE